MLQNKDPPFELLFFSSCIVIILRPGMTLIHAQTLLPFLRTYTEESERVRFNKRHSEGPQFQN